MAFKQHEIKYKRLDTLIKKYLEEKDIFLKDFLNEMGISYVTFYRKIEGGTPFTVEEMIFIMEKLGMTEAVAGLNHVLEDFSGKDVPQD